MKVLYILFTKFIAAFKGYIKCFNVFPSTCITKQQDFK